MKFFNKKSLIVLCIFLIAIFAHAAFNKKPIKKEIEFPTKKLKDNTDVKLDDRFKSRYVFKIIKIRLICGDSSITARDAFELQKKICEYSYKYNLTQEEGFIIVHTESDFKLMLIINILTQ